MSSTSTSEAEVKLRLESPEAGRQALSRLGARLVTPRHLEDNQLYDDEAGRYAARGCVVRLRREPGAALLTFKGPKSVSEGIKSREELETRVGDADVAARILAGLGLLPRFRYQKYREGYRHGGLSIELDETPVGVFLELEGEPAEIHAAAATLGYRRDEYVTDSYVGLFFRAGGAGDMLFP